MAAHKTPADFDGLLLSPTWQHIGMVPDQTFQISIRFGPFRPTPVLESVSRPSPLNIESVGKTLNTKQRVLTLEAFPPSVFFIVLSKRRKLEPDFENGKTF